MGERVCIICGEPLTARQQKYCSKPCAIKANTINRRQDPERWATHRECAERWKRENRSKQYSYKCREVECVVCGETWMSPSYPAPTTCCSICRSTLESGKPPQERIEWRECEACGDEFLWFPCRRKKFVACSDDCRIALMREGTSRDLNWRECPSCGRWWVDRIGGGTRCQECRGASPNQGGNWISQRRRRLLYERDNHVCQICGDPIDREAHWSDNWAASLDHIIPRSQGGTHDDDNLRTAHRWCNSVLGDGTYYTDEALAAS